MKKYIKMAILFMLPILKGAFIKAAADELTKLAYPERNRFGMRRTVDYNRMTRTTNSATTRTYQKYGDIPQQRQPLEKYHDVLMLAFDITGPNQALVHAFLESVMPESGEQDNGVYVDSMWIADDAAHGDCDSVVFVSKGKQEEARKLLREHGLVG